MRKTTRDLMSAVVTGALVLNTGCSIVHKKPDIDYEKCTVRVQNESYRIGVEPLDTQREAASHIGFDLSAFKDRRILINYFGFENRGQSDIEVYLGGSGLTNGQNSWHYLPHKDLKYMLEGPEPTANEKAVMITLSVLNPVSIVFWLMMADMEGVYNNLKRELLPETFNVRSGESKKGLVALFNNQGERYNPAEATNFVVPIREGEAKKIVILEMGHLRGLPAD